jgi:FtsH-binding integral membrane protein
MVPEKPVSGMERGSFGSWVRSVFVWLFVGLLLAFFVAYRTPVSLGWRGFMAFFVMIFAMVGMWKAQGAGKALFYLLFTASMGYSMNYIAHYYSSQDVSVALLTTSGIFLGLMILAFLKPEAFRSNSVGMILGFSLLGIISIEFFAMIFNLGNVFSVTNWIVVLIFMGYTLYDTGKLRERYERGEPPIYSAAAFFLDFINLFVRILIITRNRE